ncbi:MAG: ATP-binding protein [Bacteroidales bacterium]|nr:ATP-binding protein [Bacteroidales bacterium]
MIYNPFITSGYVSPEYFCDRENETRQLIQNIQGHSHTVLISPRRMGKTGLIEHCFNQEVIKNNYHTFFIDIYPTMNLNDFVFLLGNRICKSLKAKDKQLMELFIKAVKSIQFTIGFDEAGMMNGSFGLGDIKDSQKSLEEIFQYLEEAKRPCVVAIDEFQQIEKYPEKNVEALLRTYIQHCNNATFIFAGSQRHVIQNMFASASKPFYNSSSIMSLGAIEKEKYVDFAVRMFAIFGKNCTPELVENLYDTLEGHTWYMQAVLYLAFYMTEKECSPTIINEALIKRVADNENVFESMYYGLSERQRQVLKAIAIEGKAKQTQSVAFIKKHGLVSASSVQSALRQLLDRDLITTEKGTYRIDDRFFGFWLKNQL